MVTLRERAKKTIVGVLTPIVWSPEEVYSILSFHHCRDAVSEEPGFRP